MKKSLTKLVGEEAYKVECDVSSDESIATAFANIQAYTGEIDGVVHAIAYANKEELSGNVSDISRAGYQLAQDISSYSLIAVSKYAAPILSTNSGIVSLTYLGAVRIIMMRFRN